MAEQTLKLGIDSRGAKQGEREVVRSLANIREAANKASDSIDETEKSLRGIRRAADTLSGVGRAMTIGVTLPLVALGGYAVKTAADMDSLRRSLDAMTGSSTETARQLERLKVVARAPGLGFREAVQGSVNLQAVGFSAEHAERALTAFGNAIATTGGRKAELDRIIFQLSQMAATGKVLTQDLRPIITTAPAVARALNELFGTTSAEAISEQVGNFDEFFNLVIPKLESMPSVAGGAANSLENLGDAAFRASSSLGERLLPAVLPLVEGLADLLEKSADLNPEVLRTGIAFGAAAAVVGPLALGISGVATAVGSLVSAFGAGLLPLIGVGGGVILGLGALAGWFAKNKLEALEAAGAADRYARSLDGLSRSQLLTRVNLTREQIRVGDERGTLTPGDRLGLFGQLAELERQLESLGDASPSGPAGSFDVLTERSETFRRTLERLRAEAAKISSTLNAAIADSLFREGTLRFGSLDVPGGRIVGRPGEAAMRRQREIAIQRTGGLILSPVTPRSQGGQMNFPESFGDPRALMGAIGAVSQVGGGFGALATSVGQVASAFALGGPLMGGINLAGMAFKGLSAILGDGRTELQRFSDAIARANESLQSQIALQDINSLERQFALTVEKALAVFTPNTGPGANLQDIRREVEFQEILRGLSLENIQEEIDRLLTPGPNGRALLNLDSTNPQTRAFIDFLTQLEALGDRAESLGKTFEEVSGAVTDIPRAINVALFRQQFATDTSVPGPGPVVPGRRDPAQSSSGGRDRPALEIHGGVTIVSSGGESGEELLQKIERAAQTRHRSGRPTLLPGTRVTA